MSHHYMILCFEQQVEEKRREEPTPWIQKATKMNPITQLFSIFHRFIWI